MERNMDFLKNRIIAHRGYHNINEGIPENSMLAFKKAVESNLAIELDVHILKDGTVVILHDDNVKKMTGLDKAIKEMDYEEIKKLRLQGTDQEIPLFKDVLELVDGKVPLIIELKYDVKCGVLEKEVVSILKDYKGEYVVESFNPFSMKYFKDNCPEVIRGQLSSDFKNEKMNPFKKFVLNKMLFNFIVQPDFIAYDIKDLPNNRVKSLRKSKYIIGWTIKSLEDLEKARKYCDNYICENIDLDNIKL